MATRIPSTQMCIHVHNRKMNYNEAYKMETTELRQVRQEKDIGDKVDNQLKFENHIQEKVKKANNIMGLVRRTYVHLDETKFSKLFEAPVRHHLEYATKMYPKYVPNKN